ncbi:MAG: hypothetical protein GSR77_06715 [Desulfurococcales archaeon]|nr:hypothetical protein [Desulfurococcales archaeon]
MHSYKELEESYRKALERAKALPRIPIGDETIIVSTTRARAAARILYMGILHSGKQVFLSTPTETMYHLLPYRETGKVIVFNDEPRSLRIVGLVESAGLLGVEITIITPRLHPAVNERVQQQNAEIIEVPDKDPLLTMALYALLNTPSLMGTRQDRFQGELDHLDSALEWMRDKITAEETRLVEDSETLYYTPATEPGGYYYYALTGKYPLPLDALIPGKAKGLVILTGVEELTYKDIIMQYRIRGGQKRILKIDTDPITAGLYSILAVILLTGRTT